jgi:hypothetical protein
MWVIFHTSEKHALLKCCRAIGWICCTVSQINSVNTLEISFLGLQQKQAIASNDCFTKQAIASNHCFNKRASASNVCFMEQEAIMRLSKEEKRMRQWSSFCTKASATRARR